MCCLTKKPVKSLIYRDFLLGGIYVTFLEGGSAVSAL